MSLDVMGLTERGPILSWMSYKNDILHNTKQYIYKCSLSCIDNHSHRSDLIMILEGTRKLIQAGNQTQPSLHVILPKLWLKYNDMHKGDLIRYIATDKSVILLKNDEHAKEVVDMMLKQESERTGGN